MIFHKINGERNTNPVKTHGPTFPVLKDSPAQPFKKMYFPKNRIFKSDPPLLSNYDKNHNLIVT